ncbi:hypothetical protein RSC2_01201 [Bacillus paralicheniformis]|nr:HAD family hydrolase [Bacillus paralicheniformis]BCE07596.1 hypothetical protein RSC1_03753 [Bacillus paralicheniformis]BCE09405.1 hypothetical protein RSC2_01201 [Bacillus paralicheniformis]BCE15560.1 hypothetical protein RSC3_02916 [Bacillus paralicheniformis]
MSIKLIAVDMDGTFLDDDMKYNKDRFMKQYRELKARGIKFVVASGNQYDQLKSFFPSIENEIAFVSENGAYVIDSGKEIFSSEMSKETIKKVIDVLEGYEYTNLIVCGKKVLISMKMSAKMHIIMLVNIIISCKKCLISKI